MFRGKGLLRQGRNTSKCLYGLPAESPGRQRPSRKGENQPKELNKYTGGSWQTEEATHRGSFRLSHVLSTQQGSGWAGSRLGGHTHTHITVTNPTVPVLTARDTSAWPAHTQLQQPAHKSSSAQAGNATRSHSSSQNKAHSLQRGYCFSQTGIQVAAKANQGCLTQVCEGRKVGNTVMGQLQWNTNINREGTTAGRSLVGKAAFTAWSRASVSCYQSTHVSATAESPHWPFLLT